MPQCVLAAEGRKELSRLPACPPRLACNKPVSVRLTLYWARLLQENGMRSDTVRCDTIRYGTVQYSMLQYETKSIDLVCSFQLAIKLVYTLVNTVQPSKELRLPSNPLTLQSRKLRGIAAFDAANVLELGVDNEKLLAETR
jgi:hypothetical protein